MAEGVEQASSLASAACGSTVLYKRDACATGGRHAFDFNPRRRVYLSRGPQRPHPAVSSSARHAFVLGVPLPGA